MVLGFSSSESLSIHKTNFDDDSDAMGLHDLNTVNNASKKTKMNFIASDASTIAPNDTRFDLLNPHKKPKRRLQWRVGPLVKKPREKKSKDLISIAEKTVKSQHTFQSQETEVAKNSKRLLMKRGNGSRGSSHVSGPCTPTPQSTMETIDALNVSIEAIDLNEDYIPTKTLDILEKHNVCENKEAVELKTPTKQLKPPMVPTSSSSASNTPNTLPVTPEQFNQEDQNDDDSHASGGPLWQLAKLQAISEGIITDSTDNETLSSSATDGKKKKSFFQRSKSSTTSSDASIFSSSSASRMEVQKSQTERNLKAIQQLASQHLAHGEYHEAIEVLEELLRGVTEMYGPYHYRVGTALHNLSTVHMRFKNFEKAIEISRKAVTVRRTTLGVTHLDLGISYAQLGMAHMELHQFHYANLAFQNALTIRRRNLSHRDVKISRLLNNIGCCQYELSQFVEAAKAFEESLRIQRLNVKRATASPLEKKMNHDKIGSEQKILGIASTLCNLASIKLKWKLYDDAIVHLEEALLLQQSILGDEHKTCVGTKDALELVQRKKGALTPELLIRKVGEIGAASNEALLATTGGFKFPTPADLLKDVLSLKPVEWMEILEEFGAKPKICNGCTPDDIAMEADETIVVNDLNKSTNTDTYENGLVWV